MTDKSVRFAHLDSTMQGVLIILTIVAIIVPCVLGFVNFDKRIDIVESSHEKHAISTEKHLERACSDIEENEDAIHALELVDKGLTVQYQEILKNQERMVRYLENLERVDQ